jgi:hypothetical protein
MKPSQLHEVVTFAIKNKLPVLIKGAPGTAKTSVVTQACNKAGVDLLVSHPVISDPTDYKGLPFPNKDKDEATFLPFGDLVKLIKANKPTVFFLDDFGHAPESVQKSVLHLILARQINGHKVSDKVTFLAATNRRQDKAGVMGILEPVKSRFAAIIELEVDIDDWVQWAFENNMPSELIAFIRYRPNLLHDFKPTSDIINTPNPRTVAYVGSMMNAGIPKGLEYEMISGAAGEGFAAEFIGFLNTCRKLPDIPELLKNPDKASVPDEPSLVFAVCGALAHKADPVNIENILRYAERLPSEFQVLIAKDSQRKNPSITTTSAFTKWASSHANIIL